MIDTMNFWIDTEKYPDAKIWRYNIPKENISKRGADSYKGKIRNMQVFENVNGVRVEGSIAKFYNGNNVENLTQEQYHNALKDFEELTGLNLKQSKVIRVDYGRAVKIEKDVAAYLRLFGAVPRYKQDFVNGNTGVQSITYFNKTGAYCFCAYDKMQELADNNEDAPELFEGCNVLRMEYRILKPKGIRAKLGNGRNITPWELEEKYSTLEQLYLDFYDAIPKVGRRVFFPQDKQYTPAEYQKIVSEYARQIAPQEISDLKKSLVKNGCLTKQNLKRINAQEKRNSKNCTFSDTNELIVELNRKTHCRAF